MAIGNDVDIISMSWTVNETEENEQDIPALEQAVKDATEKNILMFCAASDEGAVADKTFPAKAVKEKPFKIGAATQSGGTGAWVGSVKNIDFIFPGNKVVQERYGEPVLQNCNILTGSSAATAIAARLLCSACCIAL